MSAPHLLPRHIAIIMDGNGRWAKARALHRSEGHKAGVNAARIILNAACDLGIPVLTLYTFSKENWGRPKDEVSLLFTLLVTFLQDEMPKMKEQNIRLNILGDIAALPLSARTALSQTIKATANHTGMILNLALNYSGREEILRATRLCIQDGLRADEITEDAFRARLYTKDQPDPDLVIRTSGEQRLSNYLPFQTAYAELIFSPVFWPDFTPEHLHEALDFFATRNRRFGLTQEQV